MLPRSALGPPYGLAVRHSIQIAPASLAGLRRSRNRDLSPSTPRRSACGPPWVSMRLKRSLLLWRHGQRNTQHEKQQKHAHAKRGHDSCVGFQGVQGNFTNVCAQARKCPHLPKQTFRALPRATMRLDTSSPPPAHMNTAIDHILANWAALRSSGSRICGLGVGPKE